MSTPLSIIYCWHKNRLFLFAPCNHTTGTYCNRNHRSNKHLPCRTIDQSQVLLDAFAPSASLSQSFALTLHRALTLQKLVHCLRSRLPKERRTTPSCDSSSTTTTISWCSSACGILSNPLSIKKRPPHTTINLSSELKSSEIGNMLYS